MRSSKALLLAVALLVVTFTAWAGDDAVVNKPGSTRDKSVVAPTQKVTDAEKPDQTAQPKQDAVEAPQAKTEAVRAPQPEPKAVQAPATPNPWETWMIAAPAVPSEPPANNQFDRPPRAGQGGGRGGQGGGRGNGGRGGGHFNGGQGWHGQHDMWRHQNYHGSWSFLFHFGPVIYPAPVYFPHVVRLPRNRVGVYVRSTGDDYVGIQFANSLREHLREQGLTVVYSSDNAQFELYLVSMDEDPEETGNGSAVSVSYIWYPGHKFITAQIVDVGIDEVDDLAQSVAGYANDLVDQYR
ncbi:MAG: hypothetical protein NTX53_18635 [candidate division WOR-3 bacterium]|nr:hypothetical protein [candidate division WOR-3 bacterium]